MFGLLISYNRQLTGDKSLEIRAGCASTSYYKRKSPSSSENGTQVVPSTSNGINGSATSATLEQQQTKQKQENDKSHGGVGCWDCVWSGRANYLSQGEERNWGVSTECLPDLKCSPVAFSVPRYHPQR
jgi:hypothetical protein